MAHLINVYYMENTSKSAKCSNCKTKLLQGNKVLSVLRGQGRFVSESKFCINCTEKELTSNMDEMVPLMQKIITISEQINTDKIQRDTPR